MEPLALKVREPVAWAGAPVGRSDARRCSGHCFRHTGADARIEAWYWRSEYPPEFREAAAKAGGAGAFPKWAGRAGDVDLRGRGVVGWGGAMGPGNAVIVAVLGDGRLRVGGVEDDAMVRMAQPA